LRDAGAIVARFWHVATAIESAEHDLILRAPQ
jgi:hypothetical protein